MTKPSLSVSWARWWLPILCFQTSNAVGMHSNVVGYDLDFVEWKTLC